MFLATTIAFLVASQGPEDINKTCNDVCQGLRQLSVKGMAERFDSIISVKDENYKSMKKAGNRYTKCYGHYFWDERIKSFENSSQINEAILQAQYACVRQRNDLDQTITVLLENRYPRINQEEKNTNLLMLRAVYAISQVQFNFGMSRRGRRFEDYLRWLLTNAKNQ